MNRNQKNRMARYNSMLGLLAGVLCVALFCLLGALFGDGTQSADLASGFGVLGFGLVALNNRGRFVNNISGIQGVAAGGNATLNLPTNRRYHRITFNVTDGGAAAAVSTVITAIKLIVNGTPVRTISPAQIIAIAQAQGYFPLKGELPIFFTEPYTRATMIEPGDVLSWDMQGQQTFEIQFTIAAGTVPAITGNYEYDYLRNVLPNGELFSSVVSMHNFTFNQPAGRSDVVTIPYTHPIRRIWLDSTTSGGITDFELQADGNKIFEGTLAKMKQMYNQYGFRFQHEHNARFQNATGPANLSLDADFEAITYWDYAVIFDPDYRTWKALRVARELILRPTMTNAEALNIVVEYIPGIYQ